MKYRIFAAALAAIITTGLLGLVATAPPPLLTPVLALLYWGIFEVACRLTENE